MESWKIGGFTICFCNFFCCFVDLVEVYEETTTSQTYVFEKGK